MSVAKSVTWRSERTTKLCGARLDRALIPNNANLPNNNCGGYLEKKLHQRPSSVFVDYQSAVPRG